VETRRLKAFICIVDTGNLTRAADLLGIAQPALSQQVAALEDDFGTQLLLRSRQGVSATPAGKSLYRHAQSILRQLEQAHVEIARASQEVAGVVRVGLSPTAAAALSAPLLRVAFERFPNVQLDLADGLPGNLLNEFTSNGRLDIAVLPGSALATGLNLEPLVTERLALVTSTLSALSVTNGPLRLIELKEHPLVLPSIDNPVRQAVEAGFSLIGIVPTVVAEMNSLSSLCATAAAGLGSAIVPFAGARVAGPGMQVRLLIEPELRRPLSLAVSKAAPLGAAAQVIHSLILELTQQLVDSGQWPGAQWAHTDSP
jgi:LysR family nitrogen assimilation transcriptional regulator